MRQLPPDPWKRGRKEMVETGAAVLDTQGSCIEQLYGVPKVRISLDGTTIDRHTNVALYYTNRFQLVADSKPKNMLSADSTWGMRKMIDAKGHNEGIEHDPRWQGS
ncbi:MAG: hypothetical protein M1829_003153 [Trizodia sp. TS-e1964]|nr:MAG: hypothetical protein M1829_003153 [Trizodia sp. TS-e1964]